MAGWLDTIKSALTGNPVQPNKKPSASGLYTGMQELNDYITATVTEINETIESEIAGVSNAFDQQLTAAAEGYRQFATWAELSAIDGTVEGQPGRVTGPDASTHTDPVVGGSVANVGEYRWSVSPEGWERIGDILSGDLLDAKAVAGINLSSASVETASVVRIGDDWTIEWTQGRGLFSGSVIQIADLSSTDLAPGELIYIDLSGSSPFTATKASTSSDLRNDAASGDKLVLLYNQSGTLFGSFAALLMAFERNTRQLWDPNEIFVDVLTTGEVRIYQKGGVPSSNRYTYFRISHIQTAGGSSAGDGADVWCTYGVFDSERIDLETFSTVRRIVATSSNELAISQNGKVDAMGGPAHGDEQLNYAYLLIDGHPVDIEPAVRTKYRCRKVEIIQKTTLYEAETTPALNNPVATVNRRMEWFDGDYYLDQLVTFSDAITLNFCYLAMLAIQRFGIGDEDDGGPDEFQITDAAYRSPAWQEEDVSATGHSEVTDETDYIKVGGATSGYGVEVEILDGWSKTNREARVSNAADYNKIYFDFTGTSYLTTINEEIHARARYRIMNNN